MDGVIVALKEINHDIEINMDTGWIDRGDKMSTDRYLREQRDEALASLKCWADLETID